MPVHILAGAVALIAAIVALAAAKGGAMHRGSGLVFVASMVVMAATAAALAAFIPERLYVVAGGLTLYLVVTGLLTVRPPPQQDRSIHWVVTGVGAVVILLSLTFAAEAWASEGGQLDGFPVLLYLGVALLAALGCLGDLHMLLRREPSGAWRLGRHLWRMGAALAVTTAAFFIGQAQVFPDWLRQPWLLSLPVVAVLAVTAYWLLRVLLLRRLP